MLGLDDQTDAPDGAPGVRTGDDARRAVDAWWSVTAARTAPDGLLAPAEWQALPRTRSGRPARAARPGSLPPARAVAGAAVAVAGVALGIGTLLWATEPPAGDPVVTPAAQESFDEPAVAAPPLETEEAPVDPAAPAVAEAPPPAPVEPVPPAADPAADLVVPVLVLNNSTVEGLAARTAARFEDAGWPVSDTGSLRGRIRATTVYYEPGQEASARELARRFPFVQRVLPRLEGLPGSGLTVVVTRDAA